MRLYGHWDVPLFEGGQVHSLDSAGPVSGHVSGYIHLLQSCFRCYRFSIELTLFYFLSASWMLAGATEIVSVVILVYSAC